MITPRHRFRILVEATRLRIRILEGRLDFLRTNFLPKIKQALDDHMLRIPPDVEAKMWLQPGEGKDEKLFNYISSCDPDPIKKNLQWLLIQVLRKQNPMPLEDLEGASDVLTRYAEMKKHRLIPANKSDINAFRSLGDLRAVIAGEKKNQLLVADSEEAKAREQSDVLLDTPKLLLVSPKTEFAACYWGSPTDWCTAWGDHRRLGLREPGLWPTRTNQFDYYNGRGPLYDVINKKTGERWQLHFQSGQFANKNDHMVSIKSIVGMFPEIVPAIGEDKFFPYVHELGLQYFSPAAIARIPPRDLAYYVYQKDDLKKLPPEMTRNVDFIVTITMQHGADSLAWFPKDFVSAHAEEIVRGNPQCFPEIPEHLQTQEMANAVAHQIRYAQWPRLIPEHFWTEDIQRRYWVEKADDDRNLKLDEVPEKFRSDALAKNWRLLTTVPPEKITEPMAFSVMKHYAEMAKTDRHTRYHYHTPNETKVEMKTALLSIPKKVWSKRVYEQAVGYVVPLKAVPAKWRDDAMISNAIHRDPENVKVLPNPAEWLNRHMKGDTGSYPQWYSDLEEAGVGIVKRKFFNIADLKQQGAKPLPSGASYAVVPAGTTNKRCYLFDKSGKYVLYLWTEKDEVKMTPQMLKKAENHRKDVLELVRKELGNFNMGVLNDLGIYSKNGNVLAGEQARRLQHEGVEWSDVSHRKGHLDTAWFKGKPVLRIYTGYTQGGWGRGGSKVIEKVEIDNLPFCLQHSAAIASYINRYMRLDRAWWAGGDLKKIGIYMKKDASAHSVAERKIGTIGSLSIYRNDERIGLFGPNGMIADAVIRKNGSLDKISMSSATDYDDREALRPMVDRMFAKISDILQRDKNASGLTLEEMMQYIGRRRV